MKDTIEYIKKKLQEIEDELLPEKKFDEKIWNTRSKFININHQLTELLSKQTVQTTPFKVPEGYMWCSDCNALTPHTKGQFSHSCVICGNSIYSDQNCPNCGWEEPEDTPPLQHEIILHGTGCHCDPMWYESTDDDVCEMRFYPGDNLANMILLNFTGIEYANHHRIKKTLKRINMLECSCPRVTVYPVTNIYNYSSGYVWSDACSNAMEWSYDIRCPICGEVFDVADGNC